MGWQDAPKASARATYVILKDSVMDISRYYRDGIIDLYKKRNSVIPEEASTGSDISSAPTFKSKKNSARSSQKSPITSEYRLLKNEDPCESESSSSDLYEELKDLKNDFKNLRKSIPVDEEIYIAPDS